MRSLSQSITKERSPSHHLQTSDRSSYYLHQTAITLSKPYPKSDRISSYLHQKGDRSFNTIPKKRSHLQTNPLNELAIRQTSYSFTAKITKSIDIQGFLPG
jgi:hypothetical protein